MPCNKGVPHCACKQVKSVNTREVAVNICWAEEDSQTTPLVGLMAECHTDTSLVSIEVCEQLTLIEKTEIVNVSQSHQQAFSSQPGLTHQMVHKINPS